MKRSPPPALPDAHEIDARYGLEPVIEPSGASPDASGFVTVRCPYCGEPFDTRVDLSAGCTRYVEDCQVCCQPIEMAQVVDLDGGLVSFEPQRLDQ